MASDTYKLWDYSADYEAHKVAYPWAVYAPDLPDVAGVICWCVSRERAQMVCNALNGEKETERLRAREAEWDSKEQALQKSILEHQRVINNLESELEEWRL